MITRLHKCDHYELDDTATAFERDIARDMITAYEIFGYRHSKLTPRSLGYVVRMYTGGNGGTRGMGKPSQWYALPNEHSLRGAMSILAHTNENDAFPTRKAAVAAIVRINDAD